MISTAIRNGGWPLLPLIMLGLLAPQAHAQRPGRGGGLGGNVGGNLLGLLAQKSVQDELKVSEDQTKQISELSEKQREALGGLRDLEQQERRAKAEVQAAATKTAIGGILKEDQLKRLKQISLQQRGGRALADPEVIQALGLTSEQQDRVKTLQGEAQSQSRELFQGGGDEAQTKLEALRKTSNEKMLSVLTPEQQGKWKELTGEPFKGEIRAPNFRGRNRPGAGAQNRTNTIRTAAVDEPADRRGSDRRPHGPRNRPDRDRRAISRHDAPAPPHDSGSNATWDRVAHALGHGPHGDRPAPPPGAGHHHHGPPHFAGHPGHFPPGPGWAHFAAHHQRHHGGWHSAHGGHHRHHYASYSADRHHGHHRHGHHGHYADGRGHGSAHYAGHHHRHHGWHGGHHGRHHYAGHSAHGHHGHAHHGHVAGRHSGHGAAQFASHRHHGHEHHGHFASQHGHGHPGHAPRHREDDERRDRD